MEAFGVRLSEPSWFRVQGPSPGDTTSQPVSCQKEQGKHCGRCPRNLNAPCLSCTGPGSILKSLLVEYQLCLGATLFFAVRDCRQGGGIQGRAYVLVFSCSGWPGTRQPRWDPKPLVPALLLCPRLLTLLHSDLALPYEGLPRGWHSSRGGDHAAHRLHTRSCSAKPLTWVPIHIYQQGHTVCSTTRCTNPASRYMSSSNTRWRQRHGTREPQTEGERGYSEGTQLPVLLGLLNI